MLPVTAALIVLAVVIDRVFRQTGKLVYTFLAGFRIEVPKAATVRKLAGKPLPNTRRNNAITYTAIRKLLTWIENRFESGLFDIPPKALNVRMGFTPSVFVFVDLFI